MKLTDIAESVDRRDFLRSAIGGAASVATGGLDKLAGATTGAVNSAVTPLPSTEIVWDLINHSFLGGAPANLEHVRQKASPAQVAEAVKRIFAGKGDHGIDEIANAMESCRFTDVLDEYTGGTFTTELNNYVSKVGPANTVKSVVKYVGDELQFEGLDGVLEALADKVPLIKKAFPFHRIDMEDEDLLVRFLRQRGGMSDESLRSFHRERERTEEWIRQYEAKERDRLRTQRYDKYEHLRWADDGGRVDEGFDRRLSQALKCI